MGSKNNTVILSIIFAMALVILASVNAYAACTSVQTGGSFPKTLAGDTTYCLTGDVTVSGTTAFIIGGDNISFDLGGFEIRTTTPGTGEGIYSESHKNIVINNGRISGFRAAVSFYGSNEKVLIDGIFAADSTQDGIYVEGKDTVVRNCTVMSASWGILVLGSGSHVVNNDILDTTTEGIDVDHDPGGDVTIIENNRIGNSVMYPYSTGIAGYLDTDVIAVNNRITNMETGIRLLGGIYRDNLTFNCTVPYSMGVGVINAGNNN